MGDSVLEIKTQRLPSGNMDQVQAVVVNKHNVECFKD